MLAISEGRRSVWACGVGCESPQAFTGTEKCKRLLIIDRTGVWMPAHLKVLARTAPILVADVTLAHITCQHEDFHCRMEESRLTQSHVSPKAAERPMHSSRPPDSQSDVKTP